MCLLKKSGKLIRESEGEDEMNLSKMLVGWGLLFLMTMAQAGDEEIYFYFDCTGPKVDCMEMPVSSQVGGNIWVQKVPLMTLGRSDITEARMKKDPKGRDELVLTLVKKATLQLGEITHNNIGRRFVVVVNGTVIMAPVITGTISQGNLTISPGYEGSKYLDNLPWLREMIVEEKIEEEMVNLKSSSLVSLTSLLYLGLLILVVALYFVFFRKIRK
jgi:hypothetical protein